MRSGEGDARIRLRADAKITAGMPMSQLALSDPASANHKKEKITKRGRICRRDGDGILV